MWSPWMGAGSGAKKLHVKLKRLKLEVISKEKVENGKIVAAEIKWKGPNSGALLPFYRTSTCQRNHTRQRSLRRGKSVQWDEEFECVCNFSVSKDGSLGPWIVTFNVLYVSFFFSLNFLRSYWCLILFFEICKGNEVFLLFGGDK